jgi:superfamily II DNA helicase RecQ
VALPLTEYPLVAITVSTINYSELVKKVVAPVCYDISNKRKPFSSHVIALTVDDAKQISELIRSSGHPSSALHSNCSKSERRDIMSQWSNNKIKVLVSTLHDGIEVQVVNECISLEDLRM